jgi:hypothetical protein
VSSAFAQQINTRAQLVASLGGGGTLDNFETFNVAHGNATNGALNQLDSTTVFLGQGPGLVNPGSVYTGGSSLQWNGNQYFNISTKSVLFFNNVVENITYTGFTQAAGLDICSFEGFPERGTVSFLDLSGAILGTVQYSVSGQANSRVFVGWQNAGGLGGMVLTNQLNGWAPIMDDHLYGVVPEPVSLLAMGAGLAALLKRRKK